MKTTRIFTNKGRTWRCVMCQAVFFIPDLILKEQKEVGCPICSKSKWVLTAYSNLFVRGSKK